MLVLGLLAVGPDLNCSQPAQARGVIDRLRLAEIETAEDFHRAAMWEAFGRCASGSAGQPCRERERQRFDGQWHQQRQGIEAKYRRMLLEFEERCRSSISLAPLGASRTAYGFGAGGGG